MVGQVINQQAHENSWGNMISSWINPYHELEIRIGEIAAKNIVTDDDEQDLKLAFQLAYQWRWPAGRMQSLLREIPKEQIQALVDRLLQKGGEKEIPAQLEIYLSFLAQAALLDLSDLKTAEKAASWFHSRGLIKNSLKNGRLEKEGRAIFREFTTEAWYFFHHLLDILIALTGINEVALEKHSRWSSGDHMGEYAALSRLETYGKLIGFPAIVFGFIYTYIQLKAAAFALTICATLAMITAIVAYQKYFKPCPKDVQGMKNLTQDIQHSKEQIYIRQDVLRKIEKAFKEKKGVILVGEPGSGKSWIARSLAQQIAEGKICTFIKNAQIFTCGSSRFKARDYDAPSLDFIAERFEKYGDEVGFIFDEFHSFFKAEGPQGSTKADDIKMFTENFKYVVGMTTPQEYNQYIKDQPAITDRRFIVIKVGKLENKKIKTILSRYLQTRHPTVNLDVKALDYIVQKANIFNPKTSKLDAAQSLLNRAVKEMETIEFTKLESKIDSLESEKKLVEQELVHADVGNDEALTKKFEKIQTTIEQLKKQLEEKNRQVDRLQKMEAYYLSLKGQSLRMSDPETELSDSSQLEQQWIMLQAKINMLGRFIEKDRKKLSLPSRLDCQLIDKILKEKKG